VGSKLTDEGWRHSSCGPKLTLVPKPIITTALQVFFESNGLHRNVVPVDYPKQVKAKQQEALDPPAS